MQGTFAGKPVQITGPWNYADNSGYSLGIAPTDRTDKDGVIALGGERHGDPLFTTKQQVRSLVEQAHHGTSNFASLLAD